MATPRKIRCCVRDIVNHGDHVYSLELEADEPVPRFLPGQFLHLAIDAYDPSGFWPESRVFSIASSPQSRRLLKICYSVRGSYTQRMEQELKCGREIWVKLPYGEFTIHGGKEVVLFAGGTGFAAYSAYLAGLPSHHDQPLHIVYGARSPDLLIFRAEAEAVCKRVPSAHLVLVSESEAPKPHGVKGVLSVDLIWRNLVNPQVVTFYLSGPPAMLKTLAGQLRERQVSSERIRIDSWE